ncbi:uncharacterized protein LOC124174758 [Neodiprion fabricii]|uniref:uncharacterized protein LOC124174758 n=1 Tax=Neodiprion fabricii TaxID=2872261 RepID=UPI001ED952EC|nr:uncharacterized protein LOC124174758 [Neodiprion fabricii]XP_046410161.1 uncharacterized protein LOC124174758 [Neodiprion fabricii]
MSASAVKSSMQGASMQATPSSTHSIIPMNMMAQKVVTSTNTGSEANLVKPLPTATLSYANLQPPPSQPLSLVQDHKPLPQPTLPLRISEKEQVDAEKTILNGTEPQKSVISDESDSVKKQSEANQQNNNLNTENAPQSTPQPCPDPIPESAVTSSDMPSEQESPLVKVEETKTSLRNGSKELEDTPSSNTPVQSKTTVEGGTETHQRSSSVVPPQGSKATPELPVITHSPPKADLQLETLHRNRKRKPRELKDLNSSALASDAHGKPKRNRIRTQPYQSPLPELALIVKTLNKSPSSKAADDKLIVFYKNEFLAVRNAEGSFYVCQAMQNIYKSSRRIRIRWLSQDKNNGEIYSPDFYDFTEFDCILTNLNLNKVDKNKYQLTKMELLRTENILKRAIDVEAGLSEKPRVTEEHPDGLDLSLFRDESQLKTTKKGSKLKRRTKYSSKAESTDTEDNPEDEEDEKVPAKQPIAAKKLTVPKVAAVAKTVSKGGSNNRAERAATRSSRTALPTTIATAALSANKKRLDDKKPETKKIAAKSEINNLNTLPRKQPKSCTTASNVAGTISSLNTLGRPKRAGSSTIGIASASTTSEPSARKKPRSRA